MSIEYHMLRWRRWNLLRNGTPQGARCNLGKWAQSVPDEDDVAPLSDDEAAAVNQALSALKARYPDAYQAVMVRYHDGVSNKQAAARQCGTSVTAIITGFSASRRRPNGAVAARRRFSAVFWLVGLSWTGPLCGNIYFIDSFCVW